MLDGKNTHDAGWSSPVAREAHNLEVAGSNPAPAISRRQGHPWPLPADFFARPPAARSRRHGPYGPCRLIFCAAACRGSVVKPAQTPKNPLKPEWLQRVLSFHAAQCDRARTPAESQFASHAAAPFGPSVVVTGIAVAAPFTTSSK